MVKAAPRRTLQPSTHQWDAIFNSFSSSLVSFLFVNAKLSPSIYLLLLSLEEKDASLFHSMKHCARFWSLIRQQHHHQTCMRSMHNWNRYTVIWLFNGRNFLRLRRHSQCSPRHKMENVWIVCPIVSEMSIHHIWLVHRQIHTFNLLANTNEETWELIDGANKRFTYGLHLKYTVFVGLRLHYRTASRTREDGKNNLKFLECSSLVFVLSGMHGVRCCA